MPHILVVPLSEIDNYIIGKTEMIWGVRHSNKELIELNIGDKLMFVIGMHCLSENTPKGFPRLKSYDEIEVQIEELWLCELTSKPQLDKTYPFGNEYPFVFSFDLLHSKHDFPLDELRSSIVESIRKLYTGRKKLIYTTDDDFLSPLLIRTENLMI